MILGGPANTGPLFLLMEMVVNDPTPTWEHGYRCHGYWLDVVRVGWVVIGPRKYWKPSDGYECGVSVPGHSVVEFHARTLREGKRLVEKKYKELTS